MFKLLLSTTIGVAMATARSVPMGMHRDHRPPFSKVLGEHDLPAGGAVFPTAIYYATVQAGTPPKDFAVGLDSGSGDLFVEGKGCKGCTLGPPNHQYDPAASSTSKAKGGFHHSYQTCNMKDPMATCTLYGTTYLDQVSLAGMGPVEVKVGAISSQTANFDTKKVVGGLMGLGGFDGEDVLATLHNAGKCDRVWALCMHQGTNSNGTMTVGGADIRLSDGPIKYVPDTGFIYPTVDISSMTVGGKQIHVGDGAILDTGTNILLLGGSVYNQVRASMCADKSLANCDGLWANNCFAMTEAQVDRFPPLSFQLDGVVLEMTSRDYLLQGSPIATSAGQYCLAIRNGGGTFIIGDTTMRNYYIVFDKKESKVGWGKVNKKTCGSINSDGALEGNAIV